MKTSSKSGITVAEKLIYRTSNVRGSTKDNITHLLDMDKTTTIDQAADIGKIPDIISEKGSKSTNINSQIGKVIGEKMK